MEVSAPAWLQAGTSSWQFPTDGSQEPAGVQAGSSGALSLEALAFLHWHPHSHVDKTVLGSHPSALALPMAPGLHLNSPLGSGSPEDPGPPQGSDFCCPPPVPPPPNPVPPASGPLHLPLKLHMAGSFRSQPAKQPLPLTSPSSPHCSQEWSFSHVLCLCPPGRQPQDGRDHLSLLTLSPPRCQ